MGFQKRFRTRVVSVGGIDIGGENPIRIQSMTNTRTEEFEKTVQQIIQLHDHGCEIARVTVQGKKQAYALEKIKNTLIRKGYDIPIVSDIHFYPQAAFIAADFVDKIRINPGNFADKRAVFQEKILTDELYKVELEKIEEKLLKLIEKLKKNKVALRIGVNHGSLSDRIMTRHGNTIDAMVVSAVEYTQICRKHDYHDIVFSMKASNSFIMIEAYKALVNEMIKLNWNYPLHLGVTEAGESEDGIIKSSVGIGALLLDGIGDTIRVSLTDDPHKEIDPANRLVHLTKNFSTFKKPLKSKKKRKKTLLAIKLDDSKIDDEKLNLIDIVYLEKKSCDPQLIKKLKELNKTLISKDNLDDTLKIYTLDELPQNIIKPYILEVSSNDDFKVIERLKPEMIIFKSQSQDIHDISSFSKFLEEKHLEIPVILNIKYGIDIEDAKILASSQIGLVLYEKLIRGILIETNTLELNLNILQACSLKRYKTEFISCPGCGRTLFDIQKAVKNIKEKTSHLPDVKIAIMGCIVNGTGEMQDADFGYVGSLPGKIDLYVNKKCVEKNIDEKFAVEKLISLIKKNNKWKEKATISEQALFKRLKLFLCLFNL